MVDAEEEAFKTLLRNKFELFRRLMQGTIEHEVETARITVEQARRIAIQVHQTYFRHLRLYDFVLKNTKLSEVKRVFIPAAEPKAGDTLEKAMVLADEASKTQVNFAVGAGGKVSAGMTSAAANRGSAGAMHPAGEEIAGSGGHGTVGSTQRDGADDSVTDSDMDEAIKGAANTMDRTARNVLHRANKNWNNKITAAMTKEIDMDNLPKSGAGKKR